MVAEIQRKACFIPILLPPRSIGTCEDHDQDSTCLGCALLGRQKADWLNAFPPGVDLDNPGDFVAASRMVADLEREGDQTMIERIPAACPHRPQHPDDATPSDSEQAQDRKLVVEVAHFGTGNSTITMKTGRNDFRLYSGRADLSELANRVESAVETHGVYVVEVDTLGVGMGLMMDLSYRLKDKGVTLAEIHRIKTVAVEGGLTEAAEFSRAAWDNLGPKTILVDRRPFLDMVYGAVQMGTKVEDVVKIAAGLEQWVGGDPVRMDAMKRAAQNYTLEAGRPVKHRTEDLIKDATVILAYLDGGAA